jgi:hypothetical protein
MVPPVGDRRQAEVVLDWLEDTTWYLPTLT